MAIRRITTRDRIEHELNEKGIDAICGKLQLIAAFGHDDALLEGGKIVARLLEDVGLEDVSNAWRQVAATVDPRVML